MWSGNLKHDLDDLVPWSLARVVRMAEPCLQPMLWSFSWNINHYYYY